MPPTPSTRRPGRWRTELDA
ncbi:hypothetical protein STIAU_7840, partial [Stigmatella aurantiaca DW4/3-1]